LVFSLSKKGGYDMATEKKTSYPTIPARHWWSLRKKFQQSIPASVSPGYVATALGMKEASAKANIIPTLAVAGIIDENGVPQDRAVRWRDDESYPKVCAEIRKELYPQELLDAIPGPTVDRAAVERWFATNTGVGAAAARRMAIVYELLCEADPSKTQDVSAKTSKKTTKTRRSKATKAVESVAPPTKIGIEPPVFQKPVITPANFAPSLHIDIQIHISPEASLDQIDQIFASMAKHFYKQVNSSNE
jgi:hypothetical protein